MEFSNNLLSILGSARIFLRKVIRVRIMVGRCFTGVFWNDFRSFVRVFFVAWTLVFIILRLLLLMRGLVETARPPTVFVRARILPLPKFINCWRDIPFLGIVRGDFPASLIVCTRKRFISAADSLPSIGSRTMRLFASLRRYAFLSRIRAFSEGALLLFI